MKRSCVLTEIDFVFGRGNFRSVGYGGGERERSDVGEEGREETTEMRALFYQHRWFSWDSVLYTLSLFLSLSSLFCVLFWIGFVDLITPRVSYHILTIIRAANGLCWWVARGSTR